MSLVGARRAAPSCRLVCGGCWEMICKARSSPHGWDGAVLRAKYVPSDVCVVACQYSRLPSSRRLGCLPTSCQLLITVWAPLRWALGVGYGLALLGPLPPAPGEMQPATVRLQPTKGSSVGRFPPHIPKS